MKPPYQGFSPRSNEPGLLIVVVGTPREGGEVARGQLAECVHADAVTGARVGPLPEVTGVY